VTSQVVSNSQLSTFKRCRRKYWLAYVRKLRPRRREYTGARQLGTRVHLALQVYYTENQQQAAAFAALDKLRDAELKVVDEIGADLVRKEHDLALAMLEGYFQWLADEGVDSDLTVVAAEQTLQTPSPVNGVELIGKLDLSVENVHTEEEGFLDFKTVGDLQTPLKTLSMNEQFRMYALMQRSIAAAAGRKPTRFQRYRMLKKSKRTARARPPFFADYDVYITDPELRVFWDRLYGEIVEIVRFERAIESRPELHQVIAFPTPRNECSWDCDFFAVCPLFDDPDADPEYVLSQNFEEGDPHEHYRGTIAEVALTTTPAVEVVPSTAGTEGDTP
jgi:hypothetical protein